MIKLTISIDRQAKAIAVFDEKFECVAGFTSYQYEDAALAHALQWCERRGDSEPEIVYPRITKVTMRS